MGWELERALGRGVQGGSLCVCRFRGCRARPQGVAAGSWLHQGATAQPLPQEGCGPCVPSQSAWLRAGWPGSSPAGFKGRLSLASLPGMACCLRHGVTLTFMGSESFSRAAFPQMAVLGEHSAQRAPSLWGAHPRQEQSTGSQGSGSSGSGCSPFPWAVFWELLVPTGTGGSLEPPGSGPEGWGSGGACMEKLLRAGAWHVQPVLPQRVFLGALFSGNVSILSS